MLHAKNFASCELLHPLKKKNAKAIKSAASETNREKSKRVRCLFKKKSTFLDEREEHLSSKTADQLDMDHVYVSFPELLWAYTFIVPNVMFSAGKGIGNLWLRSQLCKRGIISPKHFDPAKVVGRLCLEGTIAVHYYARTDKDSDLGDVAGFFFQDFPYIDNNCRARAANLFAVDIDLKSKRMVKAKFDDEELSASQALILL